MEPQADKVRPLVDAGAKAAGTPSELAAQVEAVITILTNREALAAVYVGSDGLLTADAKGRLFIEISTVRLATGWRTRYVRPAKSRRGR